MQQIPFNEIRKVLDKINKKQKELSIPEVIISIYETDNKHPFCICIDDSKSFMSQTIRHPKLDELEKQNRNYTMQVLGSNGSIRYIHGGYNKRTGLYRYVIMHVFLRNLDAEDLESISDEETPITIKNFLNVLYNKLNKSLTEQFEYKII